MDQAVDQVRAEELGEREATEYLKGFTPVVQEQVGVDTDLPSRYLPELDLGVGLTYEELGIFRG